MKIKEYFTNYDIKMQRRSEKVIGVFNTITYLRYDQTTYLSNMKNMGIFFMNNNQVAHKSQYFFTN